MTDNSTRTVNDDAVIDGKYLIKKHLGSGAMGEVYLAQHQALGSLVALKVMRNVLDTPLLNKACEEARILSDLHHPNIAKVHGIGITGNRLYMVMQFIEGEPLDELIKREGALKPQKAWPLLLALCSACNYLSTQNILHRDLKPSNVLVSKDNQCYLVDFGLATRVNTGQTITGQQGQLVGSALYIPPEICSGNKATTASDVYSFGCLMYEVLTGEPPYSGDSALHIMMNHMKSTLPQMPAFADNVLRKTLQKNPADRYTSFEELAQDLQDIEKSGFKDQNQSKTKSKPQTSRTAATLPLLIVGAISVVLSIVIAIKSAQSQKSAADIVQFDRTLHAGSTDDFTPETLQAEYPRWKVLFQPRLTPQAHTSPNDRAKAYSMLIRGAAASGNLPELKEHCKRLLALRVQPDPDTFVTAVSEIFGDSDKKRYFQDPEFLTIMDQLVELEDSNPRVSDDIYPGLYKLACAFAEAHQDKKAAKWFHKTLRRAFRGDHSAHHYAIANLCLQPLADLEGQKSVMQYMRPLLSTYVALTPQEKSFLRKEYGPAVFQWLLMELSYMLYHNPDPESYETALLVCDRGAADATDPANKITWLLRAAEVCAKRGKTAQQMVLCKRIEDLAKTHNVRNLDVAHIELLVAYQEYNKKNFKEALRRRRLAVEIALETGIAAGSCTSTAALGDSLTQAGKNAEAEKYYRISYNMALKNFNEVTKLKMLAGELATAHALTDGCALSLIRNLETQRKIPEMLNIYEQQLALSQKLGLQSPVGPQIQAIVGKYTSKGNHS